MAHYPAKILVASDGSEVSARALAHAAELAAPLGSEVHVVTVGLISMWTHPDTLSGAQFERIKQETQDRLDAEVGKLRGAGVDNVQGHARLGKVDGEILRLIEELDIGLAIIGNRGMGSLARILLGSDAESVVRHASCAVLVVR